jgi:uncharacterized membrane protein
MTSTVVGHFGDADEAQLALDALERGGFTPDDVSYIAHDGSGRLAGTMKARTLATPNTTRGAAIGGVSGLLLGAAALVIPGVGPLIAAGPIAAALTGLGVGAATGSVLGALHDIGVPEQDAKQWAHSVEQGGSLVVVHVNEDTRDRAIRILHARHSDRILEHDV